MPDHVTPEEGFPRLGICVLPPATPNAPRTVQYGDYAYEMIAHVGLAHARVPFEGLAGWLDDSSGGGRRVLVTIGETRFDETLRDRLTRWVTDEGGVWISVGGLCGQSDLLGAAYAPAAYTLWAGSLRSLGEGYLDGRTADHPILAGLSPIPLHYFGGVAVVAAPGTAVLARTLDSHHRPTDLPAVTERVTGKGRCLLIAPDITGSVVRIQQGVAVTRDGVSCPDGTGPVGDGVLKSDDGQVLDWLLDREPVPGVPGLSAFLQPVADQWRDLLTRAILYAASVQNIALPLLWYWPRGLNAVGHLSHDTDGNNPGQALRLLETLRAADAPGTWCVILPGYPPEIIGAIRDGGHELAMHFDALTDGCPWNEPLFDAQWRQLCEMFGPSGAPVTNKDHYLRWQGDTDLWEWCAARGIRLDQTKGASKTGEAGFNFGTCHLYRPAAPDGGILPIHELATPTQDLLVFAPAEIVPPLLSAAVRHYGVLHLLFHPAHIDKPGVADAIRKAVADGRAQGLEWWTGRALVEWEEARRASVWTAAAEGAVLEAEHPLPGATVLRLDPNGPVERWGFRFTSFTRDLASGESWRVGGSETKE